MSTASSAPATAFRRQVAARELAGAVRDGEDAGLVLAFALQSVQQAVGGLGDPMLRPFLGYAFLNDTGPSGPVLTAVGARRARTLAGALHTQCAAHGEAGLVTLLAGALEGITAPGVPTLDAAVRRLRGRAPGSR